MARAYLVFMMVAIVVLMNKGNVGQAEPQVPCYFIFGDSLIDNGNNNNIVSLAKANFLPYGIDFAKGPTGRFSNGQTNVDVIAQLLGFDDYIPSYASAKGQNVLKGVNYASAAAGIRQETGQVLGARTPFAGQVSNYQKTVTQVAALLGDLNTTAAYLSKCIYSIGLGSNDYLNNYFMPKLYSTSRNFTPEQYAMLSFKNTLRICRFDSKTQPEQLYDYGAKKFVLMGLGPLGCSPFALERDSPNGVTCVQTINDASQMFNSRLKSLVTKFNAANVDAKFVYVNTYNIFWDMMSSPASFGFTVTNSGCCGVGRNNGLLTCLPLQKPCVNRNQHVFWDAFHPTGAANTVFGKRAYVAESASDTYPIDISQLAQL